ncbi:hypothetical protein Syun_012203 [Stephania yunnanensis]|uniref:Uncharacterized protein n=1 Tax=Stephania yunnanensis TaxID=152371 RepID=A0AAP0K0E7_9MAGN
MSNKGVPQHEGNQQFHQSLSLEDILMQMIESVQDCRRVCHNIRKLDFSCPRLKDLVTDLDQYIANRQRKIDEAELCSTQPTFNPKEDVNVDTLANLEVHDVTQVEDYLIETSEECEVFQIEPEIVIALNEGEDEMKIDVNSDKPEKPQIESEEDQPLVLVQPPALLCTFDDVRLINFLPKSKGKQVGIMDSKHIMSDTLVCMHWKILQLFGHIRDCNWNLTWTNYRLRVQESFDIAFIRLINVVHVAQDVPIATFATQEEQATSTVYPKVESIVIVPI